METAKPVSPSTTDVWLNTCSRICETLGLHSSHAAPLTLPGAAREGTRAKAAQRRPPGPAAGSAGAAQAGGRAGGRAGPLRPAEGRGAAAAPRSPAELPPPPLVRREPGRAALATFNAYVRFLPALLAFPPPPPLPSVPFPSPPLPPGPVTLPRAKGCPASTEKPDYPWSSAHACSPERGTVAVSGSGGNAQS